MHPQKKDDVQQVLPQELTKQFALLPKAYTDDIVYPSYSTPLSSNNKNYLKPNHFNEVNISVLDGPHTTSLSLNIDLIIQN